MIGRLLTYLIFLFTLFGCGNSNYDYVYSQIPNHDWKYSRGYHFCDFFPSGTINISNDSIILNDTAIGIIDDLELRKFDMVMTIKSKNTNEIGRYVSK